MITIEENIKVFGLVTELTKSQSENFKIIQTSWANLNPELKNNGLQQNSGNWTKYGVTFKTDEKYFYLAGIPSNSLSFPDHFRMLEIPKGVYQIYPHKGKMKNIVKTIFEIYKVFVPKSNLNIKKPVKTGLIHFEKYDYRFKWNNPDSVIDIYLPLRPN